MRQFWSTQKYIYIFNLPGLIYRNIIYNTVIYTFREEWISFYSLQFAICTFLSLVRSEFIFPEDQWSFYSNKYQVTQCGENLASLVLLMGEVLFITVLDCKLYVLIVLDVKCQFKMWLRDWGGYNLLEISVCWSLFMLNLRFLSKEAWPFHSVFMLVILWAF